MIKLKLYCLFGLIIAHRTWIHFRRPIEFTTFSMVYMIGVLTTLLIILTMVFILTNGNRNARLTLQIILGFLTVLSVISLIWTPAGLYTTTEFIRVGIIMILYCYTIYLLQSRDIIDFMKSRRTKKEMI